MYTALASTQDMAAMYIVRKASALQYGLRPGQPTDGDHMEIIVIGSLPMSTHESNNRVYEPSGLAPTVKTASGGGHIPKVIVWK